MKNKRLFYIFSSAFLNPEPAVRIVDEMGYEFYDRYYKLGSTIDISCQVSLSYLATLPTGTPGPNTVGHLVNSFQQQPVPGTAAGAGDGTRPADSKQLNEGVITSNNNKDKTKQSLPQNIVWKKDGTVLPKDIKLSSR